MTQASNKRVSTWLRGMVAVLTLGLCGVCVPAALASQPPHPVYVPTGATSIPNDGVTLSEPQQLAVNEANQTLLVANQGAGDVAVFSSSVDPGTGATVMTPAPNVGAGVLSAPYGIAIDQSRHLLYVSDGGLDAIKRYSFTTGTPATYTPDPTFASPALGSGAGQLGTFAAQLAVDPTTHDLLVADSMNHCVSRYTAAGTFVRSFDGSAGAHGVFVGPLTVAVGPDGTTYVPDQGALQRFSAEGAPLDDVAGVADAKAAGIGSVLGTLVAGTLNTIFAANVYGFIGADPTQAFSVGSFAPDFGPNPTSIAVDDGTGGNLYYIDRDAFENRDTGVRQLYVLPSDPIAAPGVSVSGPTAVSTIAATVAGTVDAGDGLATASTSAHFEYYTTDPAQVTVLPDLALPAAGPNSVSASLVGLRPNTTYHVQLKAERVDDALLDPTGLPYARTASRVITFTTPAAAPAVTEPAALTGVTATTAVLGGSVDPFGLQGTYHFEYGLTDAYGSRSPAGIDAVLGAPAAPQNVKVVLSGLTPSATYHYRLVATTTAGVTYGPDREFITDAPPVAAAARGYEQITPVDKGGAVLKGEGFLASDDGSSVVFGSLDGLPGAPVASGSAAEYLATRLGDHWSDDPLEVPGSAPPSLTIRGTTVLTGTTLIQRPLDSSHAIVYSDHVLAPGAVPGLGNIYRRDNATGALTLLGSVSARDLSQLQSGYLHVYATPDSAHVYVQDDLDLEYYELAGGQATLVSITPGGAPLTHPDTALGSTGTMAAPSGGAITYSSATDGAFINRDGHVTPISVSERPGDPATNVPAAGATFSADGRYVFFLENATDPLTPDGNSEPGTPLYRYTLAAPAGHHLTYIGGSGPSNNEFIDPRITISDHGNSVMYDSSDGMRSWHEDPAGLTHRALLTTANDSGGDSNAGSPQMSADGRYFAIGQPSAVTADPTVNAAACGGGTRNGHCVAVYLFDLDANPVTVVCVSCAGDGSPPAGDAGLGAVTDDGQAFFTTPSKLVGADANTGEDVYAYQAGRVRLISRGTIDTHATLQAVTPDAHDVFILTDDQLVTQDDDHLTDLYDARVGGGFPAQSPPAGPAACSGRDCHEAVGGQGATSGPAAPSESVLEASKLKPPPPPPTRVTLSKVVVSATGVRLLVHASSRGTLRLSGRYLTTLKRAVAGSGTYTLRVSLTHAAQRLHRAHRRLQVGVRASLTPPLGAAAVATITRPLHG